MRRPNAMTLLSSLQLEGFGPNDERLGQILRRLGFVQTQHLQEALVLQKLEQQPLGQTLIKLGRLTEVQLEQALRVQQQSEPAGPS
jgi:hypothetical protein